MNKPRPELVEVLSLPPDSGYYWVQYKPFNKIVWTVGFFNSSTSQWRIVGGGDPIRIYWEYGPKLNPPEGVVGPLYFAKERE